MTSDFNYRGKLPFRIISSSVNTGYNAHLTSAVGQKIEIVDLHNDEYGGLQDSPLQGPFTEKWVGGNQHRHIELNTGSDSAQNRPEAFIISGSTNKIRVYGPDVNGVDYPRAIYKRDNLAKSPLNIKNIKNTDRSLGNFSHNYQVVQTSGRDLNENFIENNLTSSGVLTTKFVTSPIQDNNVYTLPEEPNKTKSVFVERFSAPGDPKESSRGSLDRQSEQYSPNNSLTTRNIVVRQKYNSQLTQHAAQFNSGTVEGVTVHGVNRNTIKNIELSGNTFITSSDYDNFWVQHAIPSTDLRYSWISQSIVNVDSVLQYQNPYKKDELIFNSSSFVRSGSNNQFAVDNIGINSLIKDKKGVDISTNIFNVSGSANLSSSFSEIANSAYQYSVWRQLKTGEHPVARKLRENNIVSIEGAKTNIVNGTQTPSKKSNFVLNYTEPPITSKFKPIQTTLGLKGSNKNFTFTHTHGNNLSTFATSEIVERLGISEDSKQTHDLLSKFYNDPNKTANEQNPVSSFVNLKYSETLYPREVNAYLAETRARTAYILDQPGTGSRDGYDIQLGTQRAFWRDKLENRQRSETGFYNSMNYEFLEIASSSFSDYARAWNEQVDASPPLLQYTTFIDIYKTSLNSIKVFDNNFSGYNSNSHTRLGNALTDIDPGGKIIVNIIDNGSNGELNGEVFFDYYYTSSTQPINSQLIRVTDMSVLLQFDNQASGSYTTLSSILDYAKKPKISYVAFIGGFESGSRSYGNIGSESEIYDYEFFNAQPSGIIRSTLDSGLRYDTQTYGNKKPWFDSYDSYLEDIRTFAKDHSIISEFRISTNIPYYITENADNFRIKNSSFLEIDGIGQNYRSSQFPRINLYNNNFINSYVRTDINENKFLKSNNLKLKLNNIKFTVSGIKKLLPYNGFYPQDRTVQLANLFNNFLDENVGGGFLKINGTGDYTQILVDITQSSDLFAKNTIMPYFFAPGILYNTIKSGISVDFPSVTGTLSEMPVQDPEHGEWSVARQFEVSDLGVTASLLAIPINSRMPFESLIFPEQYIPKKIDLTSSYEIYWDNLADPVDEVFNNAIRNCLFNIKIDCNTQPDKFFGAGYHWKNTIPFAFIKKDKTTNPSYSMAMSNFLAEIPKFFLKNSSMNVFRSAELKDWKTFEIGKKYYFDLKMKKSEDLVMIESYSSSYHITGSSQIEKTFNGRYFGWPVDKTYGPRTAYDNLVIHNDPAYAPFTPPYFEGEAILRFELSASKTSYDNVSDLFSNINLTQIYNDLGQVIDIESEAFTKKMSIEDCMNIFGIGQNPIPSFDNQNIAQSFEQIPNVSKQYWAISPKLETPILDFSEQQFFGGGDIDADYFISSGFGRGMWSGYGKIPTGSKGITIEIAESFPLQTSFRQKLSFDINKTGSLLKQVGFVPETKKIGQLAETKQISEAIVLIPYVDSPIQNVTLEVDGHNFFAINREKFELFKGIAEQTVPATIPGEPIGYVSSITKMVKAMKNYVIPPNFNFLKYPDIKPFVMYLFEFEHTLDQQDLADIWQGVMPKIAMTAQKDEITFSQEIGENELFGANFEIPENMKWMVFKVKKKAEWNYFAVTENIGDDDRFKFSFANSQKAKTPDYSYNWPYDYFSLVELAKVDISLEYKERPTETQTITIPTQQLGQNQFRNGNVQDALDVVDFNTSLNEE